MSLTSADTHNMVAYLNKSDASEGFNQVIDFLNGSYIKYALAVNLTIYVSCIKQFWNTVLIKQSNDVTRLQALVDKKKVVITEAAIRDTLCLDDANGVDYLPNEEIFAELARMAIKELRRKVEIAQKENDGIQLTVDKLENTSKGLNKLIECQMVDNCKKGLGYESYNAVPPPYTGSFMPPKPDLSYTVPPPYTGSFMPPKPDLSYTGLYEFVNKHVVENYEAKSSKKKPKVVRKNNDAPVIEEWVLDNKEEEMTQPKILKKTVKPSILNIEFVKPRQQEKTARKTVKKGNPQMDLQDKQVIDNGCLRHMTGNMSYLTDYEKINGGYVVFGGNPKGGKITGRGRKFNFSEYIFESIVRNVDSSSKFYMYPRVGKGFSRVETPLFEGMLVVGEIEEQGDAKEQDNVDDAAQRANTAVSGDDEALDACAALTRRVVNLKHDKVAQDLEITKLKTRIKKLKKANKVKALKLRRLRKVGTSIRVKSSADTDMKDASNQGRMIAELDRDTGIALMDDEGAKKKAEDAQVASDEQVKGKQAEIYQIDMDHASKVLSMQKDELEVQEVVEAVTTVKLITEVVAAVSESVTASSTTIDAVPAATITAAPVRVDAASTRRRKGVVIRDPEEESTAKIPDETKSKDKGK
nr:hypothetical protein [Tanacetum cinerariifolium]